MAGVKRTRNQREWDWANNAAAVLVLLMFAFLVWCVVSIATS